MDIKRIGPEQLGVTMDWTEARILTNAMMATLGGDISYPEYKARVGAEPEETVRMIVTIQRASRSRRRPKGQFTSTTQAG
jgi:hypothetical protein